MDDASDFDRDVDNAMRMFERAHVGSATPLTPVRPSRVMLVLDGSDQDDASIASAVHLREVYNTETLVLDAREHSGDANESGQPPAAPSSNELATQAASRISGARSITRPPGESFEAILQSLKVHDVNLLIVPCPFGRSFVKIGADSVGTVVDVLLSRCSVPFLVIRHPDQPLPQCVGRVSVLVGSECDVENRAAAWAFGLAQPGGKVSLNLVVEREHFENVRTILESVDPDKEFDVEMLTDVLTRTHQNLHAAMSKTAGELGVEYALIPQPGEIAPPHPLSDTHKQLLVLPLEVDDRFTQGFVIDRIRRSPHPVLVVSGHVKADA
ncbi:universal stress protein [Aporhodopirellula aestuarii]|uniref:Universal stress protein n=1 Tax=Aporhodopirellula aestuarii TaxID=2950107 RepID=A0ABT0U910_9BACT|nr:universal stress protein [Aporhodopirellula aestuarii]MCM2373015.1 universal stress protein [Aporhodopirellula aestuarii]